PAVPHLRRLSRRAGYLLPARLTLRRRRAKRPGRPTASGVLRPLPDLGLAARAALPRARAPRCVHRARPGRRGGRAARGIAGPDGSPTRPQNDAARSESAAGRRAESAAPMASPAVDWAMVPDRSRRSLGWSAPLATTSATVA